MPVARPPGPHSLPHAPMRDTRLSGLLPDPVHVAVGVPGLVPVLPVDGQPGGARLLLRLDFAGFVSMLLGAMRD